MTKENDLINENEKDELKHSSSVKKIQKCAWKKRGTRWSCWDQPSFLTQDGMKSPSSDLISFQLSNCPARCSEHKTCNLCLLSDGGGDGMWSECAWSTELEVCLSPPEIPLRCLGGICGAIVSVSEKNSSKNKTSLIEDVCPKPCSANTNCKDCLENTRCGWCAISGSNGGGRCIEGAIEGPLHEKHCEYLDYDHNKYLNPLYNNKQNMIDHSKVNNNGIGEVFIKTSWHYNVCAPEK